MNHLRCTRSRVPESPVSHPMPISWCARRAQACTISGVLLTCLTHRFSLMQSSLHSTGASHIACIQYTWCSDIPQAVQTDSSSEAP